MKCVLTIFFDIRDLDKRGYRGYFKDNFAFYLMKPYVVTPYLNSLHNTVQMKGHNIHFYAELTKKFPKLSSGTPSGYKRVFFQSSRVDS